MYPTFFLLALPLLSSARPQDPVPPPPPSTVTVATTITTSRVTASIPSSTTTTSNSTTISNSTTSSPQTTTTTDPNALTPSQRAQNFANDYASLIAAQQNNTLWSAIRAAGPTIGSSIPRASAAEQEQSYIAALATASGASLPQPAYITALPADQRAYLESFNRQVASIADVDFRGIVPNATASSNTTSSTVSGGNGAVTPAANGTLAIPSPQPPPAVNTTSVKGVGSPSQPTGVYKMAAGAAMGVLGVAVFL